MRILKKKKNKILEKDTTLCVKYLFWYYFINLRVTFFGKIILKKLINNWVMIYTAAVQLANEEDLDAAILALERIVDKGSDGYVTLAK